MVGHDDDMRSLRNCRQHFSQSGTATHPNISPQDMSSYWRHFPPYESYTVGFNASDRWQKPPSWPSLHDLDRALRTSSMSGQKLTSPFTHSMPTIIPHTSVLPESSSTNPSSVPRHTSSTFPLATTSASPPSDRNPGIYAEWVTAVDLSAW